MKSLKSSGWLLALLCLAACETHPNRTVYTEQPVYDSQPTTTTVVQPQPYGGGTTIIRDNDNDGFATGVLMGHLLSNSGNNSGGYSGGGYSGKRTKKVTINKTYNTYHAPAPTTRPARYSAPSRPAYQPSRIRSSSPMSSRAVRRR